MKKFICIIPEILSVQGYSNALLLNSNLPENSSNFWLDILKVNVQTVIVGLPYKTLMGNFSATKKISAKFNI